MATRDLARYQDAPVKTSLVNLTLYFKYANAKDVATGITITKLFS